MNTIKIPASVSKATILTALVAVAFSCCFAAPVSAQESAGQRVVLLDIGKVFKEHTGFNKSMESMQAEVEVFRARIQQEQAKIQTMAEELRGLEAEDPKARQLEMTLTKMTADLQVEHQLTSKDFVQREAKLYFRTYADVSAVVSAFCDTNGIAMVLRHAETPLEASDRQSILQSVNNPVVFESGRDITSQIIAEVNSATARQAQAPAAGPALPSGQTR